MKLKIVVLAALVLVLGTGAWAYLDDFSSGIAPGWQPNPAAAWSLQSGAYRVSTSGDTASLRTDWAVTAPWVLEADITPVSQPGGTADNDLAFYAGNTTDTLVGLAGFTYSPSSSQLLIHVKYISGGNWYDAVSPGWLTTPDTSFHVKIERPGYDYLRITVTGNLGFIYVSNTTRIPQSVLDAIVVPGLRAYATTTDFDNVSLTQRTWAYTDDFATAPAAGWAGYPSTAWSPNAGKYRGTGIGANTDINAFRWDCMIPASGWVYEADMSLVSQPSVESDACLALAKSDSSLGLLATFHRLERNSGTDKECLIFVQYIDSDWHTALMDGWYGQVPDANLHLKVVRPSATADYLIFTITGDQGFKYVGKTDSIAPAFLDSLTYPGFRMYNRTTDYDNFNVRAATAADTSAVLLENFSGAMDGCWRPNTPNAWSVVTDSTGNKWLRGNKSGDEHNWRPDWMFKKWDSFTYEADAYVRSLYADPATIELAISAPTAGGYQDGILAGFTYSASGAVQPEVSALDQYGWWPLTSSVGWCHGVPDRLFHIRLDRAPGDDFVTLTIKGDKGYLFSAQTDHFGLTDADGLAYLSNLGYAGFRLNGDMVDFDNVQMTVPRQVQTFTATPVETVKTLADGAAVQLSGVTVSAKFYNEIGRIGFAVQKSNRVAGIRVLSNTLVEPGGSVVVNGIVTTQDGEKVIDATSPGSVAISTSGAAPVPYAMNGLSTAGGAKGLQGAVANVAPSSMSKGVNNIGVLVKIVGKVTAVNSFDHPYEWSNTFYVDDGSGIVDGSGNAGIKCRVAPTGLDPSVVTDALPALNSYVDVTGVMGVQTINGVNTRFLWTTKVVPH